MLRIFMGNMSEFQALKNVFPLLAVQYVLHELWFITPEYELCNSCIAHCALFLIRPFITKKYTFGLATSNPCFLCALSDVACCLLYVPLTDIWCHVLFILSLLVYSVVSSSLLFIG